MGRTDKVYFPEEVQLQPGQNVANISLHIVWLLDGVLIVNVGRIHLLCVRRQNFHLFVSFGQFLI